MYDLGTIVSINRKPRWDCSEPTLVGRAILRLHYAGKDGTTTHRETHDLKALNRRAALFASASGVTHAQALFLIQH